MLAFRCQRWGGLPDSGGMNDQELQTIVGMDGTLKTYDAFKARDKATNSAEFSKRHPDIVAYCFMVEDLRDG